MTSSKNEKDTSEQNPDAAKDVQSDPAAEDDANGWSAEGGATEQGPAV